MRVVRSHWFRSCFAIALVSGMSSAFATQVWQVGAGTDCEANSIQDAVDLAAQAPDTDSKLIQLADDLDYSAQAVQIDNLDVTIRGGLLHCSSLFYTNPTIISGDGASGPVFDIGGTSNVAFSAVEIRDGNAFTGGGINFSGNGTLAIDNTLIDFNTATYGGGINAAASGGTIDIYLDTETEILRNTADNGGGGIELSGQSYLYALQPDVLIAFNAAHNGFGGGIDATGKATVTLGSPGYHGLPLVYANVAQYGGGVSIEGDGSTHDSVWLRMFAMDPSGAVAVEGNSASVAGGGIYIKPRTDFILNTRMCAQDFRIDGNVAPDGAAIYLDWDTVVTDDWGAKAFMNVISDDNPPAPCDIESLGATHCAPGVPCNEISNNETADSNGNPTPGAVVLIGTSAEFHADRIAMHGNVADSMFRAVGNNDFGTPLELSNCLTGANQFARELIHLQNDDNTVTIDQCTFAPDIINSTHMVRFDNSGGNSLRLTNSIVDEPGTLTVFAPGGMEVVADYVLTNDGSTLPSPPSVLIGEPEFVDLANGDYHLMPTSFGVDFAPAGGGIDLDGKPRDIDLAVKPNLFGPRDLGAYEVQPTCSHVDTIYCNGFEN